MPNDNTAENIDFGSAFDDAEAQATEQAQEGAALMDWENMPQMDDALSEMMALSGQQQPQEGTQQAEESTNDAPEGDTPGEADDPPVSMRRSELQALIQEMLGQEQPPQEQAPQEQAAPEPEQQTQEQTQQQNPYMPQVAPDFELTEDEYNEAMESRESFQKTIQKAQESMAQRIMQALPAITSNISSNMYATMRISEKFYDENPTMSLLPQQKVHQEMFKISRENPNMNQEQVVEKLKERLGPVSRLYAQAFQEQKKEKPKQNNSAFASRGTNPRSPDKQPKQNAPRFGGMPPNLSDIVFGGKGGQ